MEIISDIIGIAIKFMLDENMVNLKSNGRLKVFVFAQFNGSNRQVSFLFARHWGSETNLVGITIIIMFW